MLSRLAVGNPSLALRYLVKSSSFFRVVFQFEIEGWRLGRFEDGPKTTQDGPKTVLGPGEDL